MALNITGGTGTLADPYILGSPLTVNGDSILQYVQALPRYESVYFQLAVGANGGDWTITVDSTPDTYNLNLYARDTDTTIWTGDNAIVRVGDGDRQVSVTVQAFRYGTDAIIIDVEDEHLAGQTLTDCRLTLRAPIGWAGFNTGRRIDVSSFDTVNLHRTRSHGKWRDNVLDRLRLTIVAIVRFYFARHFWRSADIGSVCIHCRYSRH